MQPDLSLPRKRSRRDSQETQRNAGFVWVSVRGQKCQAGACEPVEKKKNDVQPNSKAPGEPKTCQRRPKGNDATIRKIGGQRGGFGEMSARGGGGGSKTGGSGRTKCGNWGTVGNGVKILIGERSAAGEQLLLCNPDGHEAE